MRRSRNALQDNGEPTKELLTLFQLTGSSFKNWIRHGQKERWQADPLFAEKEEVLLPLLLHLLDGTREIAPTQKEYEYALILGGVLPSVQSRLHYLIQLWTQGVRFKKLIFLGCARPLDPTLEDLSFGKDESEMMQQVYQRAPLPSDMRALPLLTLCTPMQKDRRPHTEETVHHWLSTHPTPGHTLVISSQPFSGYQDAVMRAALPFSFETAAPSTTPLALQEFYGNKLTAVLLDNLAQWLLREQKS